MPGESSMAVDLNFSFGSKLLPASRRRVAPTGVEWRDDAAGFNPEQRYQEEPGNQTELRSGDLHSPGHYICHSARECGFQRRFERRSQETIFKDLRHKASRRRDPDTSSFSAIASGGGVPIDSAMHPLR